MTKLAIHHVNASIPANASHAVDAGALDDDRCHRGVLQPSGVEGQGAGPDRPPAAGTGGARVEFDAPREFDLGRTADGEGRNVLWSRRIPRAPAARPPVGHANAFAGVIGHDPEVEIPLGGRDACCAERVGVDVHHRLLGLRRPVEVVDARRVDAVELSGRHRRTAGRPVDVPLLHGPVGAACVPHEGDAGVGDHERVSVRHDITPYRTELSHGRAKHAVVNGTTQSLLPPGPNVARPTWACSISRMQSESSHPRECGIPAVMHLQRQTRLRGHAGLRRGAHGRRPTVSVLG